MNILCIADIHVISEQNIQELINAINTPVDCIILLGDNPSNLIIQLKKLNKKIFGIIGNHDTLNILEYNKIENIHGKCLEFNNIIFTGISGSNKYKNINFPSLTQEESYHLASEMQKADILITHTSPYGYHEKNNDSHAGLSGILHYIKTHKPSYHFHGHQHINKISTIQHINSKTTIVGIYGATIINILTDSIQNIFTR